LFSCGGNRKKKFDDDDDDDIPTGATDTDLVALPKSESGESGGCNIFWEMVILLALFSTVKKFNSF